MRRSSQKILTTYVGSLPGRRDSFAEGDEGLRAAVREVIDTGIDIINEGEYTKGGDWLSYIDGRFGGFELTDRPSDPSLLRGKDRETFANFYKFASERGTVFYNPKDKPLPVRKHWVCTGPITYARFAISSMFYCA
jgi:5-methyltetrahydropteroyltriglutamate--homocysteine methyltransferase